MKSMQVVLAISIIISSCTGSLSADTGDNHQMPVELAGIKTEVQFPSQTQIEQHQAHIAHDLKWNSLLRMSIKGAIYAGAIGLCYGIFRDYKVVSRTQLDEQTAQNVAWMAAVVAEVQKKMPDLELPQHPIRIKTGWGDSMWSFMSFVCQNLALMHISELVNTKIFHDVSVEWFTKQQTALESIYKELGSMGTDIQTLKKGSIYITQYQADRYANSLIRLHNALLNELEMVIGYIQVQVLQMKTHVTQLQGDAVVGQYLHKRAADLAQKLHDLKETYTLHSKDDERILTIVEMFDQIQQFSVELNSSLSSFKRFETQMQKI